MAASTLTKKQVKKYGPRPIDGYDKGATITANVRHDDECGNGHNTFAITGEVREPGRGVTACGCLHEDVARIFPELATLIKWHLCSTDGPMHYPGNVTYLAGDRDCWGRQAGEPSRWECGVRFNDSPVTHRVGDKFFAFLKERHGSGEFQVVGFQHDRDVKTYGTHYTLAGFGEKWHECPFRDKAAADEFCEAMNRCKVEWVRTPVEFSQGKARELDSARRAAIWPEATDDELTAPDLKERLEERLPALLDEFRAAVESLGFTW